MLAGTLMAALLDLLLEPPLEEFRAECAHNYAVRVTLEKLQQQNVAAAKCRRVACRRTAVEVIVEPPAKHELLAHRFCPQFPCPDCPERQVDGVHERQECQQSPNA